MTLAPWDIAAGIIIIREAGGIVTDLSGAPAPVGHTSVVAGNPAIHRMAARDALAARTRCDPLAVPPDCMQLVECVPNFSEGQRPEVVARSATRSPPCPAGDDTRCLVRHVAQPDGRSPSSPRSPPRPRRPSPASHGPVADRPPVHRGDHPRIGATDVVPFVPLEGATMEDCVALARTLGERVGRELSIPVYLYERAATRPDRENLADVRRGEFEGLRERFARIPSAHPTSARRRCTPPPAPSPSAPVHSSSRSTSTSAPPATSRSPNRSQRPYAVPPEGSATSKRSDSRSTARRRYP